MSKNAKIIVFLVAMIVITLLVTLGGDKDDTGPIKIGFIGPLTGDVASLGNVSKAAVEVAVEEINQFGGINGRKVEAIYEDTKCTPAAAVSAAQKMINIDKVTAIVGGLCSSETSAFVKLAMDAKVPTIAYCSSAPNLTGSGKYFFRDYPSDAYQGKYAAEYAYNTLNARNVAILYHISDWGTGIKDVFNKRFIELGGRVVLTEGTASEVRDYKTQLSKVKAESPDYLYMPMYTDGALVATQQLQDLNIKVKILGADAWSDPKFVRGVNRNADIIYIGSSASPTDKFRSKLSAKIPNDEIAICAPQAYDAADALFKAFKAVGTDPDEVSEFLHNLSFDGASGPISFDNNGDIVHVSYVVKRIKDGQAIEIK